MDLVRGGEESQMSDVMRELRLKAYDHCRLPMQWNDTPSVGFASADAKLWMTINRDRKHWNVSSQLNDRRSGGTCWLSREHYADKLVYGAYTPLSEGRTGETVLGHERRSEESGESAVVLLNFSEKEQKIDVKHHDVFSLLVSDQRAGVANGVLALVPVELLRYS